MIKFCDIYKNTGYFKYYLIVSIQILVENAINWSSSEDDLSDLESSAEIITIKPKKQAGKPISTRSTDIQWHDRIDFENSDLEQETDHKKCTSPAIGITQQVRLLPSLM